MLLLGLVQVPARGRAGQESHLFWGGRLPFAVRSATQSVPIISKGASFKRGQVPTNGGFPCAPPTDAP